MENLFLKTEPKKDMKTVADYNKKRLLEMFRFSCFNSACAIVSGWVSKDVPLDHKNIANIVYQLAERLYNYGVDFDYFKFKEEQK